MFSTRVLLLAVSMSTALAGPWASICAGKSSNEIRTCDSHGCGQYSAQRNQRPHPGVDVLCPDGSTVFAPFTGTIVGQEKPYKTKNAINNGVRISGRGKGVMCGPGAPPGGADACLLNAGSTHSFSASLKAIMKIPSIFKAAPAPGRLLLHAQAPPKPTADCQGPFLWPMWFPSEKSLLCVDDLGGSPF